MTKRTRSAISTLQGPARLHPRRLQRAAQGRHDHRRHAHHARRCRPSSTRSTTGATVILASHLGPAEGQAGAEIQPEAGGRSPGELLEARRWPSPRTASASRRRRRSTQRSAGRRLVLLENLRFHAEEEKNDAGVREAAGRARRRLRQRCVRRRASRARVGRRRWSSTVKEAGAGLLMEKELRYLGMALGDPGAAVRRDHRRRQGLGQDRGHREPARRASIAC